MRIIKRYKGEIAMKILAIIALIFTMTSCGTSQVKLSSKGEKVKVYKSRPGKSCSVLSKVIGVNEEGSADLAENHARNLVGNAGGNGITFDEEVVNGKIYKIHSTGYKCKN